MDVALGDLVRAEPALVRLSTIRLPVKTAYQIAKALRHVRNETQGWEELRNQFIKELGSEREPTPEEVVNGFSSVHEVTPQNREQFMARMTELAATNVHIDIQPFTLDQFGAIEIAAADLDALGPLLHVDQ